MREGRIFYQGPVEDLVAYFTSKGFLCPENYNPSDYVMDICQSTDEIVNTLFMENKNAISVDIVSEEKQQLGVGVSSSSSHMTFVVARSVPYQVYALIKREAIRNYRDTGELAGRFGVTLMLCILFSLIFMEAAGKNNGNNEDFNG
jgi:hypothetical protein